MELPELTSKRSTKSILSKESTKRAKLTFPALFRYIRGRNSSVGRNSAIDSSNLLRPIPLSTDKRYLRSGTRKKFKKIACGSMIRFEQKEDLLEEKLNLFIHPYNHSVTVRNHMTFDEREKNAAKALESIGKLDNKWAFVKDFIFQQNKDQFREVCYNANKKLYDKFNVNGIWKKFFKLTKSSKDVLNIGVLPPAKWKRSPGKMRRHYKYYKGLKRRSVASSRDSSGKKSSLQPDSSLTKSKFSKEKSPEPSMNNITEENVSVNDCNNLDLKVQKVFKKNTEAKERKSSKNYLFNMKGKKKYNKKNSLVPPTKMKTLGIEVKNYFRKPDSSIIENQSERISKLIDTHEEIHKNLKIGKFHRVHCRNIGSKRIFAGSTSTFNCNRIRQSMNNGKRKVVLSPPSTQHSFKCLSPILSKNARKISKEKGILHLSNVKSTESSDGLPNFSTILKTNVRDFTLQDPVCESEKKCKQEQVNVRINEFKDVRKVYDGLNKNFKQRNILTKRYRDLRHKKSKQERNNSIS